MRYKFRPSTIITRLMLSCLGTTFFRSCEAHVTNIDSSILQQKLNQPMCVVRSSELQKCYYHQVSKHSNERRRQISRGSHIGSKMSEINNVVGEPSLRGHGREDIIKMNHRNSKVRIARLWSNFVLTVNLIIY